MPDLDKEIFYKDQLVHSFNLAAAGYDHHAILQKYTADELIDRVQVMNIQPGFVLDLGSGTGRVSSRLAELFAKSHIVQADISLSMLQQARSLQDQKKHGWTYLCGDAEQLPFAKNSFDLVVSNLMLQWGEDLKKIFVDINESLKPGGVFVFTTLGPSTLIELREAWESVDSVKHVNDFVDMHVLGDALVASGMAEPVMETDNVELSFESVMEIMRHLKNLGAHNVNYGRRRSLTGKGRLNALIEAYEARRENNGLPCTYEVVYGHAWKAGEATPMPKAEQTISLSALKQSLSRFSRK